MTSPGIISIIKSTADGLKIDPNLAISIASVESNFDPLVCRYEPKWKYFVDCDKYAARLAITEDTETVLQAMSWGCMQVMGSVCRELGFMGMLTVLNDPQTGVLYGCRKLKLLTNAYSDEQDVISAYNAGHPNKINDRYGNQNYVDKVNAALAKLRPIH